MNAFNTTLARFQPLVLSMGRVITGLRMFQYGCAKVLKVSSGPPVSSN